MRERKKERGCMRVRESPIHRTQEPSEREQKTERAHTTVEKRERERERGREREGERKRKRATHWHSRNECRYGGVVSRVARRESGASTEGKKVNKKKEKKLKAWPKGERRKAQHSNTVEEREKERGKE